MAYPDHPLIARAAFRAAVERISENAAFGCATARW
jgi:hypothetical protein